jgi:drug/metabolite transporter (DMT)-like permease
LPKETHPLRGYVYIAAATFFWGVSASMGRAAFTGRLRFHGQAIGSIDPLILSQSRTTFSLLLLSLIVFASGDWGRLKISRADFGRMALLGVFGLAAANFFYYLAIQKTNVATAITVQYTAPVWVLLYMVARGLQKLTLQRLAAVALAVAGIAIAIGVFNSAAAHLSSIGVVAALLAAFSCAFYNISGHSILTRHDHWTVLLYMTLAASVFWLVVNPPWKIVAAHYSPAQWLFLGVFSLFSMLIPFSFYFAGLRHLDPTRAIVTSCLEPIFAILIAAVTLGEIVRPVQSVGMIMVLAAIVIVQLADAKQTIGRSLDFPQGSEL